jgi:hypothetical protein
LLARKLPFDGFAPSGKAIERTEEWEDPIDYDEDTREEFCLHADDRPHVGFEGPSTRNPFTRIVGHRLRFSG